MAQKALNLAVLDRHVGYLEHDPNVRVYVDVQLVTELREAGWQTIEHEPIEGLVAQFSASWWLKGVDRNGHRYEGGGQVEAADRPLGKLATGIVPTDVPLLDRLWQRWHLNDMRAGCAHMPSYDELARLSRAKGNPDRNGGPDVLALHYQCEAGTGYKWGHAWLIDPIPDDVQREMTDLIRRLNGSV